MKPLDKLHVIWRAYESGRRHVIGVLERTQSGFAFSYDAQSARAAADGGFDRILGFPELDRTYHSGYLFPMFAQRIPSPARTDRPAIMARWGVVDPDDVMEVLAKSGGILATDRIETAEYRGTDDDLTRPLEFRIAGQQKRPGATAGLTEGMQLELTREVDNSADSYATTVARLGGDVVGYVPRQYAALIAQHLEAGHQISTVTVRKIILPELIGAWVVRSQRM